ncbi:MAG: hypothetical protein Q8L07_05165 [Sediminibacterium sp.]|nr:hypothetical protein [Sediminibacterium sp.]MDP1810362.1 hypothetical protein [Sediminibacterium sp.]MDP3128534.1 hypothetical protein [Sediminibacterium sp.]
MYAKTKKLAVLLIMPLAIMAQAQQKLSVTIRTPIEVDFQKAEIIIGPYELQKNTAINFGIAGLINVQTSKRVSLSGGIGYFRERFAIRRPYNHQTLNPGVDSLPVITKTTNYDYNLVTIPLGIQYLVTNNQAPISIGIEYIPGFAVSSSYNGEKPFASANNKRTGLTFFSHIVNLTATFSFKLPHNNLFGIEPYVRLLHCYKKDAVLYENSSETITRNFDAIGVYFFYRITFYH